MRAPARRHGIRPTTVQTWRERAAAADIRMGLADPCRTVLTVEETAIVAFRTG